jgi:hypothetical protein
MCEALDLIPALKKKRKKKSHRINIAICNNMCSLLKSKMITDSISLALGKYAS